MKIGKLITAALGVASIANEARSLGHQNQGRELERNPYVENLGRINFLPDDIHPYEVQHSKHNNGMNADQTSRLLDGMQRDDPRHPYSAQISKKKSKKSKKNDEIHPHKVRHSKHNNVMNTDQTSRLLDEMQVDDPNPYSAQKSKQSKEIDVEFSKHLEDQKAHDRAIYQLVEKESEFVKLLKRYITEKPAEINLLKSYREQSEELCKELLLVRNDLKTFVNKTEQKMESLEKYLKNDGIENRTEVEEYEFRYIMDLDNLKNKKREANSFLANCRKLTRFLKNEINYLRTSAVHSLETESPTIFSQESTKSKGTHLGSTYKTTISMPEITNKPTTALPTLSPQEESIAIRFEDLSNNFNMATKNIKYLREQINEFHLQLRSNKKMSPSDIQQTEKNLNIFENIILPTLKCEKTNIQYAIINEKNCIELLVKKGKLSPSLATKYTDEYNKLINNFEQSNNRRNKRGQSMKPTLSEKLTNTAIKNNKEFSRTKRESTFER
ncbi:hypothetical protein SFB97_01875 [Enterococcus hirae]|uniref:hypothetical protein n=1 Tax=Enterococcus hirae TaxID=1354 RepID=UPI00391BC9AC